MKILIASGIFPPAIGGPASYVPDVAAALAAAGDHITVVTAGPAAPSDQVFPFRVIRVDRPRSAARWMAPVRALLRAADDADVLFAVGWLPQSAAAALRLRRPMVARVVSDLAWDRATAYGWTADDLDAFHSRRYGLRVEALKAVQRWAVGRAARLIAPSRWLAAWLERLGVPSSRIRVIPNAVTVPEHIQPARPAVPTPYLVAAVGRLVPVKRIDLAIAAIAELPEASLLVIGDGPEKDALQHLAVSRGVASRVRFIGAVDRETMYSYLAACDVLVLCSAHEGFPHAVIEAMSLGVPVVSTRVGGVAEIVADGDNGMLVEGTPDALAGALKALLREPELRRRISARARADVAERFSFPAMVAATRGVLAEVAE